MFFRRFFLSHLGSQLPKTPLKSITGAMKKPALALLFFMLTFAAPAQETGGMGTLAGDINTAFSNIGTSLTHAI